jgi:hypothetical protein
LFAWIQKILTVLDRASSSQKILCGVPLLLLLLLIMMEFKPL